MKKLVLFVTLVLVATSVLACSAPATPTPKPQATTIAPVKSAGRIVAEGRLVPVKSAALSFQVGGVVAQIPATVGAQVKSGATLVQLDSKQLDLQLAQADANLASAQAKFNQLKRGPSSEELAAAQQALKSAQTTYDKLLKPDANEVANLRADVDKAQAALKTAQTAYDMVGGDSNPNAGMLPQRLQLQSAWIDYQKTMTNLANKLTPPDAQVQQALSAVQTAKNQLAKLTPTAEDLAAAEAGAKSAQAARDLAAEQLTRAKLVAPFDGVVVSIDAKAGEQVTVGAPAIRIADTSAWQVETTDLTELNVVNIKEGDTANVTLDALAGVDFSGKITSIKGFGDNRQGDIVYAVVVKLDTVDPRLRWNMTAKVTITK